MEAWCTYSLTEFRSSGVEAAPDSETSGCGAREVSSRHKVSWYYWGRRIFIDLSIKNTLPGARTLENAYMSGQARS